MNKSIQRNLGEREEVRYMGRSDSFTESVKNVRAMNERLQWPLDTSITKDEIFKEMIKFKWTAAILLKNCIPEYRNLSPLEIAKLIKDERDRGRQSDEEIIQDEIDLISGTEGTGVEKNTIKDVTFRVLSSKSSLFINLVTVNFEMQNKFKTKKPNTISRAVYYAASGLRETVAAGDKEYTNMHKVYTIWLCAEQVVFHNGIDASYIYENYGMRYAYKHRFRMSRFYDELPCKFDTMDEEADLMEVVMIDLKVLGDKVKDSQNGDATDDEKVMLETIYDISHAIELMEQVYEVDLTRYEKGVHSKMGLIERQRYVIEEQKRVNEEQERQLQEKDKTIGEKDKTIGEKDKTIGERDKTIGERDKTIEELKKIIDELQGKLQLS